MYPVSDRFLESLKTTRWLPRAQWTPDRGETWHDLTVHDWSVSASSKSQTRWSLKNLLVSGTSIGRRELSPYGARVRFFMGLVYDRYNIEEVPLGVYRVEDISQSGIRTGRAMINGLSLESQVMDERFHKPRTLEIGTGEYWVRTLLGEVLPEIGLSWRLGVDNLPKLIEERDRWGLIDGRSQDPSIARSLGGRVFCDSRGYFIAAPTPSLEDDPVWSLHSGSDGVLIEPQQTLSRDKVYNQVVAIGEPEQDAKPIAPAIASDDDPISPTYYKGPFGQVPLFYSSKMITSFVQAQRVAYGLLAPRLGLQQTVDTTSLANFAIEPDDVLSIEMPDGTTQTHIVDTINFSSSGMSLSTRATTSTGNISVMLAEDAAEDQYGEGKFDG